MMCICCVLLLSEEKMLLSLDDYTLLKQSVKEYNFYNGELLNNQLAEVPSVSDKVTIEVENIIEFDEFSDTDEVVKSDVCVFNSDVNQEINSEDVNVDKRITVKVEYDAENVFCGLFHEFSEIN